MLLGASIGGSSNAYAGNVELQVFCNSPKTQSTVSTLNIGYKAGATEGFDNSWDSSYIRPLPNAIGAFTEIEENGDDPNQLNINKKDSGSTTKYSGKVETIGNNISGNAYWKLVITDMNDLEWKNIFFSRYGKDANMADPNVTPLATWDVKYKDGQGWFQHGYFSNPSSGTCDQIKFPVFNHADLNRDQKVNFSDYAILVRNFGRTGINKGSGPNNLDDYADIDGSTIVDTNDLGYFTDEWLWMADPNGLISKLTPDLQKQYLESLLGSTIFGDKAKTEVVKVVKVSPDRIRGNYEGLIPEIAENNRYQPEQSEKPTLNQMLALSDHNGALQKPYETIDQKLLAKSLLPFLFPPFTAETRAPPC